MEHVEVKEVKNEEYKILHMKARVVNEMAPGDFERLKEILFKDNQSPLYVQNNDKYFTSHKMKKLGRGHFGTVYEFVGSDGYKYAVKISRHDSNTYKDHDAAILSKLQSIEGYNKLFCYFEGRCHMVSWGSPREQDFLIMVTKKIYGFRIADGLGSEYCKKAFFEKVGDTVIQDFLKTIENTYLAGYKPDDVNHENVMVDIEEGKVVIVDVGCFYKINESDFILTESIVNQHIEYSGVVRLCGESNIFCEDDNKKYPVEETYKDERIHYKF